MIKKRKRRAITIRIAEELIKKVDDAAYNQHRTRNTWIVQAILKELKKGDDETCL